MCHKPKSLVVEDDPASQRLIALFCERAGFEVTPAKTGVEALQLATSISYRLIVTSFRMPGMDGFELCRRLRSAERHANTHIILVSAITGDLDKSTWQQLGLKVLQKPLDLDALMEALVDAKTTPTFAGVTPPTAGQGGET